MRHAYNNASVPHEPKPAYHAAVALQRLLGNRRFIRRMAAKASMGVSSASVFVALFEGGTMAAWTNSSDAGITAVVRAEMAVVAGGGGDATGPPPVAPCWQRFSMDGTLMADRLCMAPNGELTLPVTQSPSFLVQLSSMHRDEAGAFSTADVSLKTDGITAGVATAAVSGPDVSVSEAKGGGMVTVALGTGEHRLEFLEFSEY